VQGFDVSARCGWLRVAASKLRGVLHPIEARIAVAFVYRSMARIESHTLRDVDLLLIGETRLAALTPA
jgi:hypothetical protein